MRSSLHSTNFIDRGDRWDWDLLTRIALGERRRVSGRSVDAEDAAQAAVLQAYEARRTCHEPQAPSAWLRNLAHREAHRVRARELRYDLGTGTPDLAWEGESDEVIHRLATYQALVGRSESEVGLLIRRYVLDQSCRQIAADLGMPASTVRVRLHRTRNGIRRAWSGPRPMTLAR